MSDSSVFLGVIFSGNRRSDVMVRLLPQRHQPARFSYDRRLMERDVWPSWRLIASCP
jgi:hypothetical protein